MEQEMVRIVDLHAAYGRGARRVAALQGVNLQVRAGEIFGLLGPNGAGKTTLLSTVEGLHRPERGSVHVAGIDVLRQPQAVKRLIGIQLQRTSLMDDLTVGELMQVYAAMYEVFPTAAEIEARLAAYGIAGLARTYPRRLSGGQQQRLALALAQVNNPAIVLLDEPTSALDPHARRSVWELIRAMQADGQTVILTTHSMEEAETLCGRVAIIDRGRVIACDTPAQLVAGLHASSRITLPAHFSSGEVEALPGVATAQVDGSHLTVETNDPLRTLVHLYELAQKSHVHLAEMSLRQPNLEDVFLALTGRALQSGEAVKA